jgi:hypothetical protein
MSGARDESEVADLLEAWSLAPTFNVWRAGASEESLGEAERVLGPLPPSLRGIYETSDGLHLLDGNLQFVPLVDTPDRGGLTFDGRSYADWLRDVDWMLPAEALVFGDNGGEEVFALWTASRALEPPVLLIGEGGQHYADLDGADPGYGGAVVGTTLARFLRSWTAYYVLLCVDPPDDPTPALDALGVPPALRREDTDDTLMGDLRLWADPGLVDPDGDPYRRLDVKALRLRYGSA